MMFVPMLEKFLSVLTIGCKSAFTEITYTAEIGIHVNSTTALRMFFLKSAVFLQSFLR